MTPSKALIHLSLLFLCCGAPHAYAAEPEQEVKRQYFRATKAAELKFLDGQFGIRSRQFRLIDQEGNQVDLSMERSRLQSLYDSALEVKESASVTRYKQLSLDQAQCEVLYHTEFFLMGTERSGPRVVSMETRSLDTWTRVGKRWKQISSKILKQEMRTVKETMQ